METQQFATVSYAYGYASMAVSIVFFSILNRIVLIFDKDPTRTAESWKWRNLFISWIHAFIVGVWDITCFWYYPQMFVDLLDFNTPYMYAMVGFSTGYFVYDLADMVVNDGFWKSWDVALHHIAVGGIFFYNVVIGRCIGYTVIALMAEINSFFLHSRKLLQMMQVCYHSILYRINVALNLCSFIVCRFMANGAIFVGMIIWSHRVSRIYLTCLSGSMIVMFPVNCILFWRLVKSDIFRKPLKSALSPPPSPRMSEKLVNGINNNLVVSATKQG